jgi:hypothetical protein
VLTHENNCPERDNKVVIVGITLGTLSTILAGYASYVTIILKRKSLLKGNMSSILLLSLSDIFHDTIGI